MSFSFVFPFCFLCLVGTLLGIVSQLDKKAYFFQPIAMLLITVPMYMFAVYGWVNRGVADLLFGTAFFSGQAVFCTFGLLLSTYVTIRKALTGR